MKCPVCGQKYTRPESVKSCLAWHRICDLNASQVSLRSPKFEAKVVRK